MIRYDSFTFCCCCFDYNDNEIIEGLVSRCSIFIDLFQIRLIQLQIPNMPSMSGIMNGKHHKNRCLFHITVRISNTAKSHYFIIEFRYITFIDMHSIDDFYYYY